MLVRTFTEKEYKSFKQICSLRQPALIKTMRQLLIKKYPKVNTDNAQSFIFAEGTIPIALVAHMDTVFPSPPREVYYDRSKNVMWSPDGLGADDRAGVFAIIKILQRGLRPHIILTTDEEKGGIGAAALTTIYHQCPFKDLRYIIQLDRQGSDDCVFYDCNNEAFVNYVESFGFSESWGTFSDISYLCPDWKIAGVNLSVGYLREHSIAETLNVGWLLATIDKVCNMLSAEMPEQFVYIPYQYTKLEDYIVRRYLNDTKTPNTCCVCHKQFKEEDLFPVLGADNEYHYYCPDCVILDGVNWCSLCGNPYEVHSLNDAGYCYDCIKKLLV